MSYNAIVIGGGIIGNSIAYYLARKGMRNVLLLEKAALTSGTTFHSGSRTIFPFIWCGVCCVVSWIGDIISSFHFFISTSKPFHPTL